MKSSIIPKIIYPMSLVTVTLLAGDTHMSDDHGPSQG
jgi:hypothetical protein